MKLSRKKSIRLSFVASKLALSYSADERMALLTELLDELGIDAEQRAESKESAARHIRYMASKKRKAVQPVDSMNLDEITAHNKMLLAKLNRLLEERRAATPDPAPSAPEPAPTVEDAPQYDITAKQRRTLAAFDDMTDSDQLDALRGMWCDEGEAK